MKFCRILLCLPMLALPLIAEAQPLFSRLDSVQANEVGNALAFPGAGGMNLPQFSHIDLDGDGTQDLFVYDRAANRPMTFLHSGVSGQPDYRHAPQYEASFPSDLLHFALLADYDCDGKADLFTTMGGIGLKVYRNTSAGALSFSLAFDTVFTDLGAGPVVLQVNPLDIPSLRDIDSDGDIDILTFDGGGSFVEWHKNLSMENQGNCSAMEFMRADACWGKFQESGLDQTITMNVTCRVAAGGGPSGGPQGARHAGSTLATFDEEPDGDYELVIGDLIYDQVTYLHNAGTATAALIDSVDIQYPAEDVPVRINIFDAPYVLDLNNDGKEDMVVAPNAENIAANYSNVWYYQNVHASGGFTPNFDRTSFLQEDMIDVGSASMPVLFDYNGDSLLDLLLGNYSLKISANNISSGLTLYENIGTATHPVFDLVSRNFKGIAGLFTPPLFNVAPTVGDLDADGDTDLLIGESNGRLHYFENVAGAGQPVDWVLSQANFQGIDVGNFSVPLLIDWDRDGLLDIVSGEQSGRIQYYRNIGTAQVADFSVTPDDNFFGGIDTDPACCLGNSTPYVFENPATQHYDLVVGGEKGQLMYYQDAEMAPGAFPLTQAQFGGMHPGERSTIAGGDLDGDGIYDWVVGNIRGGVTFYKGTSLPLTSQTPMAPEVRLELYPNPSNGILNVQFAAEQWINLNVKVCDLHGRVLLSGSREGASGQLAISGTALPAGVYIVQVSADGFPVESRRWVVAK